MPSRRWPWVVTSVLLMASAVAAAWSTYLYWLPCRGTLLNGSVLRGFRYGPDFSDACLRRMDGGLPFHYPPELSEQTPWAPELGAVSMALAGTAWLVLVLGMRWPVRTKTVAALPGVVTLTMAAGSAVATADWLVMALEAAALVALVAIWRWQSEVRGRDFVRVLVVAWGSTAFGVFHIFGEYILMTTFSDADWDMPPLTGYLTVATLVVSAILTVALTLRPAPSRSEDVLSAAP